jgi:hypothetical protein
MMTTGLLALLSNNPDLSGVGIRPVMLPSGFPMPAMTYQIVGGSSYPTLDGDGLQKVRMQFDCYGNSYLDATNLREKVRKFLNGFSGQLSDGTFLQFADLIQSIDFPFDSDPRQFRCGIEFYLWFCFP